uniref:Tubulin tyrosine ligase-like family, member 12 n=1 Tax=Hippocampus comes TaxID=109280 RepID=A0A3Q2Z829_HIPCM
AGEVFAIIQIQENYDDGGKTGECMDKDKPGTMHSKVVVSCQSGLQASQPTSIFLVDHAWTYRVDHARQQLQQIPGLLSRMASVMGLDLSEKKNDADGVELVMENMWLYNQTFQRTPIDCAEEKIPVWYIMDEFGSQVRHSDQPSCGLAPLFFAEAQAAFTVLWPLRDLQKGDEVTRDFAYGESDPLVRQCRVCPKITEPADSYYEAVLRESKEQLPVEIHSLVPPKGRILKVYSEMSQVINHLTHAGFELTVNEEEADIIWSYNHIKDYRKFSTEQPHVMLNQFPCENLITVKDCLAALARRVTSASDMIPNTLNLHTELPQFIKHDQEQGGQDIHCICKPWNLARGMDNTHQQQPDLQRHRPTSCSWICRGENEGGWVDRVVSGRGGCMWERGVSFSNRQKNMFSSSARPLLFTVWGGWHSIVCDCFQAIPHRCRVVSRELVFQPVCIASLRDVNFLCQLVSGVFVQRPISTFKCGLFLFSELPEFGSEPWIVIVEGAEGLRWYTHVLTETDV